MLVSAYDMCSTQSAFDMPLFVDIHIEETNKRKKTKLTSSSIIKMKYVIIFHVVSLEIILYDYDYYYYYYYY